MQSASALVATCAAPRFSTPFSKTSKAFMGVRADLESHLLAVSSMTTKVSAAPGPVLME